MDQRWFFQHPGLTFLFYFVILIILLLPIHRVSGSGIEYYIPENEGPKIVVDNLRETNNWGSLLVLEDFEGKCPTPQENAIKISMTNFSLLTTKSLDRELCSAYEALVWADSESYTIILKVGDVNDNKPSFSQSNCLLELEENLGSETEKSEIYLKGQCEPKTFEALDDDGDSFKIQSFSIISGNEDGIFDIEASPDEQPQPDLVLTRPIRIEDASENGSILLTIAASDGEYTGSANITIRIIDLNDNAPIFDQSSEEFTVKELATKDTFVGVVAASDADRGDNAKIIYSIMDEIRFRIDNYTGEIFVNGDLDREKYDKVRFRVRAANLPDSDGSSKEDTMMVIITIEGENEFPPEVEVKYLDPKGEGSFLEDSPADAPFALLKVNDLDYTTAQISWRLESNSDTFKLAETESGYYIVLKGSLDRETQDLYKLKLLAIEEAPRRETVVNITFKISDVNDNQPIFDQSSLHIEVEDNTPSQTVVGQVLASDPDLDNEIIFELLERSGNFQIDGTTGKVRTLNKISCMNLDEWELMPISLEVRARDSGEPELSTNATLKIHIVGFHTSNPDFVPSNEYSVDISEDLLPQTCFLTIAAALEDCPSAKMSYALEESEESPEEQNWFKLDPESGKLCSVGEVDFETSANQGSIQLHVVAYSHIYRVANSTATVHVLLADVNEYRPVMSEPEYDQNVTYTTLVGTEVAAIKATDRDAGLLFGQVKYFVVSDTSDGTFHLNSDTGNIHLSKPFPRAELLPKNMSYFMRVEARDGGDLNSEVTSAVRLTVIGLGVEPPVFDEPLFTFNVSEGTGPVGTEIGAVNANYRLGASKNEESDPISYSIETESLQDIFNIGVSSGSLKLLKELDAETQSRYVITISAISGNDVTSIGRCQVEILVADVNEHRPEFLSSHHTFTIEEGLPSESLIGNLSAFDNDTSAPNNYITYSMETTSDFFQITQKGNLLTKTKLDREVTSSYDIVITTSDGGNPRLSSSVSVKIDITDINDNQPEFDQVNYVFKVPENTELYGTIGTVAATDQDQGSNAKFEFSLAAIDDLVSGTFAINSTSGEIYVTRYLDTKERSEFKFEVLATDFGNEVQLTGTADVVIEVLNSNDATPVFTASTYSFDVEEGSGVTEVGQVFASDSDSGENGQLDFSISEDEGNFFSITPSTGVISSIRTLDRESSPLREIEVEVRDRGQPTKNSFATVYVHIMDTNDEPPEFELQLYHVTVFEGAPVATVLLTLHAEDRDSLGSNSDVEYFLDGNEDESNFVVDRSSGELKLTHQLDHSLRNSYVLTVTVKDQGVPQLSSTCLVSIEVSSQKDFVHDPVLDTNFVEFQIDENVSPGSGVGFVHAYDRKTGSDKNIRYCIILNYLDLFGIDPVTGELYTDGKLDFESDPVSNLKVRAINENAGVSKENNNSSPKFSSSDLNVKVRVRDKNDNTPMFEDQVVQIYVRENENPDSVIGMVTATDEDTGSNGKIFYSILDQSPKDYVAIDSSKGTLTLLKKVDYETLQEIDVVIMARDLPDDESQSRASYSTVLVLILDENDNSPVFEGNDTITISEDHDLQFSFFKIQATDADSGKNGAVEYYLDTWTDMFSVDPETGLMFLVQQLDREKRDNYTVSITARDVASPALATRKDFFIKVTDVNDNKVQFIGPFDESRTFLSANVSANATVGTVVTQIMVRDADLRDQISFELVSLSQEDEGIFTLDTSSGYLRTAEKWENQNRTEYSFTIFARDAKNKVQHQTVAPMKIFVDNQNDHAPKIANCPRDLYVIEEQEQPVVAMFNAYDDDKSVNGVISFSLKSDPSTSNGEDITKKFKIVNHDNDATLTLVSKVDREERDSYTFFIVAEDHGSPPKSSECLVTVQVLDLNDNAPILSTSNPQAGNVFEEIETATALMTPIQIIAVDPDKISSSGTNSSGAGEPNGDVRFKIEYSSCGNESFIIDEITGDLSLYQPLDHEKMKECVLEISGTDNRGEGLTGIITITIRTLDTNDNAPYFDKVFHAHFKTHPNKGDNITTLSVIDADSDEPHRISKFSFTDGSTKSDDFELVGDFNQNLVAAKDLNKTSYLFLVEANNPPFSSTGLVDIVIGEEEPERLNFTNSSYQANINENSEKGVLITKVEARLVNESHQIQYKLFSPSVNNSLEIDPDSGEVRVKSSEAFDFEEVKQISAHVEAIATVNGEQDREIIGYTSVVVHVNNLNDNWPYFKFDTNHSDVNEGKYSKDDPMIIKMLYVGDKDQRYAPDGLTIQIESISPSPALHSEEALFEIRHQFLLTCVGELDRETTDKYEIVVSVTDSGLPEEETHTVKRKLIISVLDENDNPAVFGDYEHRVDVPEDSPIGHIIGTYTATDKDMNPQITYNLSYLRSQNEPQMFSINRKGQLVLIKELDRETRSQYNLVLTAHDGVSQNPFELLVQVQDVNDHAPKFDKPMYEAQIDSGIPINTKFLTVHAQDPDKGENGTVEYFIVSDLLSSFEINHKTGEIYPHKKLEPKNQISMLTLLAKDRGEPSRQTKVVVNLVVLDHRPSEDSPVLLPIAPTSVPEDRNVDSIIAKIAAQFQDGASSSYIKYKIISGNKDSVFKLVLGTTMNIYGAVLILAKPLDREVKSRYNLQILAYDERNRNLNSTGNFTIDVTDVNDNEPKFVGDPYRANLSNATAVDKLILRVDANDPDEIQNAKLTYKITTGDPIKYFDIDDHGWIRLRKKLDMEVGKTIKLTISVSDSIHTSLASVYLSVLKEDMDAPVFTKAEYNFAFFEGRAEGFAFNLKAFNGYQQDVEGFRYLFEDEKEIVDKMRKIFYIHPYNGQVDFLQSPDFEESSNYSFHVKAINMLNQTDIAKVNVVVRSVDEFKPVFLQSYKFTVRAEREEGTEVGQVVATDQDKGPDGVVIYKFSEPSSNFRIDPYTGKIYINQSLTDNKEWLPKNDQSSATSIPYPPLLVEASSGTANSLHKIQNVEIIIDITNTPGLLPSPPGGEKNPISGIIIAVIVATIVMFLVVAGIATLACVFNSTNNRARQASLSGSPTRESINFSNMNNVSPSSTPNGGYPSIQMNLQVNPSHLSNGSSGRGSAINDGDSEIRLITERNYLKNAKVPDFLSYQKDSGFTDGVDNVSMDSVANIAEVIYAEDEPHVYASASIEDVHPFADEAGRTGMSSLIYSKLHEIGADQFEPQKAFQGSFNSLVGQELHNSYNWDHLLNWNPQYQQLAQVFADIAKLKDDNSSDHSPGALPEPHPHYFTTLANQKPCGSGAAGGGMPGAGPHRAGSHCSQHTTPSSKKATPPPFLSMVQPGRDVHPGNPNAGIVSGHPHSRHGYPMPSPMRNNNNNSHPNSSMQHQQQPNFAAHGSNDLSNSALGGQKGGPPGGGKRKNNYSNASLTGSTSSGSTVSATNMPANHKSMSKQNNLAMGVSGATAARNRPTNSATSRNYVSEHSEHPV